MTPRPELQSSPLSGRLHEVRCALPIDREAPALQRLWLEERTQRLVMAHIAEVTAAGELWHWKAHAKWLGQFEWDSRVAAEARDGSDARISWRSLDGAQLPNEGELMFAAGRTGWGTEVRLSWRFDPPGGWLGDFAAARSGVPDAIGALVLRRFKSLAETGEVPTLAHNPTTRGDPDPYGAFE